MSLPSVADVNEQRVLKFKERVAAAVQSGEGHVFAQLIEQIEREQNIPAIEIAAALAGLLQGPTPFLLSQKESDRDSAPAFAAERISDNSPLADEAETSADGRPARERGQRRSREDGPPMESFRIEVGHLHGVQPGNIVGAIANEAGLDGRLIGHIDIREDHSFVDLPEGMPKEIFRSLQKVRVRGAELRISRVDSKPARPERRPPRADRPPARNDGDPGKRFPQDALQNKDRGQRFPRDPRKDKHQGPRSPKNAHKPRHARKDR